MQQNAFEILANTVDANGMRYNGKKLEVRSVGPAVDIVDLSEKAKDAGVSKKKIHASYFDNDPVTGFTTSNPTMGTLAELLVALKNVYRYDNSAHSCGGTGAPGCNQVEFPVKGGPQGAPEGNARLRTFVGGKEQIKDKQK